MHQNNGEIDSIQHEKQLCEMAISGMIDLCTRDTRNLIAQVLSYKSSFDEEENEKYIKKINELREILKKIEELDIDKENGEKTRKEIDSLRKKAYDVYKDIQSSLIKRANETRDGINENTRVNEIFSEETVGRSVLDTGFLYKNKGGDLYSGIEKDNSYQAIYEEGKMILSLNNETILNLLPDDTVLVDYGCYNGDKAKSLLDGTKKSIKYQPVDVNENLCNIAGQKILSLGNIEILDGIISKGDITEPLDLLKGEKNLTYMFTGGSIGNYNDETIHKIFSETLRPNDGCNLVIDYYKAPKSLDEIKDLLKCYDNEATKNWFINGLINLGFIPSLLEKLKNSYSELIFSFDDFKTFLGEYLEFSVRYEFTDDKDNKYYAELIKGSDEINVFKYTPNGVIKCDYTDIGNLNKLKVFPGRIVEGFTGRIDIAEFKKESEGEGTDYERLQIKKIDNTDTLKSDQYDTSQGQILGRLKRKDKEGNDKNDGGKILEWMMKYFLFDMVDFYMKRGNELYYSVDEGDGLNFRCVGIEAGRFYPIEISRRFSEDEIKSLLEGAGRHTEKIIDTLGQDGQNAQNSKFLNVIVASTNP